MVEARIIDSSVAEAVSSHAFSNIVVAAESIDDVGFNYGWLM